MAVDARGFQLGVDFSPIQTGIGNYVSQRIAERLSQKSIGGDMQAYSDLAARNPRAAMAVGSILKSQQENMIAQQEAEAEKQKQRQSLLYAVARGYNTANDKQAYLTNAAKQLLDSGQKDLAQQIYQRAEAYAANPSAVDQEAATIVSMFGPEASKPNQSQTYQDLVAMGYKPGTPEFEKRWSEAKKSGGQNISLTVDNGKQDMTKATESDVQGQILDAEKEMSSLNSIASKYSADFLTYKGRVKAFAGRQFDRAGVESELTSFNAKRTAFKNEVNQFFNKYKKEITGAAAGEQEMIDLRNSIFNENLGPEEFMAAYNQFMEKARKNYELNKRTARTGVDVAVDPKYKDMNDDQLKKALGL